MTMNKRTDWKLGPRLALLAIFLLLWPAAALALQACGTTSAVTLCGDTTTYSVDGDCDSDGFTNGEECNGITRDGVTIYKTIAGCKTVACSADALDPTKPDLFYLLSAPDGNDLSQTSHPGETSSLLLNALGSDPNSALKVYANGLSIRTHRISNQDCGYDRLLIKRSETPIASGSEWYPGVRAAQIVENYDPNMFFPYIGYTKQGKPGDKSVNSTIYTKRIMENVDTNCGKVALGSCKIVSGRTVLATNVNGNQAIYNYYILQLVAHEMGHGSMLAGTGPVDNYHYFGSKTVMDDAATVTSKGVYTIPTNFNPLNDPKTLQLQ